MTSAQRLVAVWMAGALATVVVYRVRALPGAEIPAPPAAAAAAPPSAPTPGADDPPAPIVTYLRTRFDGVRRRHEPVVLAYKGAPLIPVDDPTLRRSLRTRFFVTRIVSLDHLEPWPVVVSHARFAGGDDIRATQVSVLGRSSRQFLSQFLGIAAPTLEARRELALAIARLLARTTYEGHARSSTRSFMDTYAELWHGREHWRDILLFTDADGRVSRVAIVNVVEHRLEIKVSSR